MKGRIIFLLLPLFFLLCAVLFLLADRDKGITYTYGYGELIRFHVIANSDSKRDQDAKYHVRDALAEFLRPRLREASDFEEAKAILLKNRYRIAEIAQEALRREGLEYGVSVSIGRFMFPARAYGGVVLPAGEYEAVRVVLGEGKGANWWCVLFPPLCFVDISGRDLDNLHEWDKPSLQKMSSRETAVLGRPVMLRLRLLEWIRSEGGRLAKIISS